ncbi:MAG: BON domain-containing protein [Microcoleus vaginatus WJT46-NPBG5]|jgi:hypothetical protein|nr:BON domain-containing protein [Microcoleus vaginatus WJT46-NPBG5]
MKKLTTLLLSGLLVLSVGACSDVAKTSSNAPDTTAETNPKPPDTETAKENQKDGTSEVRRAQADSDIRAREQRNNVAGNPLERADDDLESEIRSKLEVNLPASSLAVKADDGAVEISGVVPTAEQLARIEPLAKEIKGVKTVDVKATVKSAVPGDSNEKDQDTEEEKGEEKEKEKEN